MASLNPLSWFRREEKASAAGGAISAWTVGRAVWTERNYESLANEAYLRNSVAFRCTKMISGSAATPRWLLHNKAGKEFDEHPLLDLLNHPTPLHGGATMLEAFYAYLLLSGNSYLEAVGPNNKPPRELWNLRPDRTRIIAGPQGIPQGFEYEAYGRLIKWDVDPLTGKGPILHLKEFHPLNDWYGMSRVEAAAYGIDRHNAASAHNKALLDNGARPSGALIFKPVGTGEHVRSAPEDVVKKAEERLQERHGGPENAGRALVFGGNVDWTEMGLSPRDMDFGQGKDDAARDICTSFGVPHILIVPGESTYNNVREAKLELWEDTVLPLIDRTTDALNTWLAPMFGDDLRLAPDLDDISALEYRREIKRKSTLELVAAGLIDADEGREALQYGPREAGKLKKIDATVLKALLESVKTAGYEPLLRYLKSVGLVDETATPEQLIEAATAHLEDDDDEIDNATTPAANEDEIEDEDDDAA